MYAEQSPDGNYTVEIYRKKRFFAAPGDGGISGSLGYIRLLDKDGNEIGNSFNCPPFSLIDLELDLGTINNTFFYSRGKGINLKTGRCD